MQGFQLGSELIWLSWIRIRIQELLQILKMLLSLRKTFTYSRANDLCKNLTFPDVHWLPGSGSVLSGKAGTGSKLNPMYSLSLLGIKVIFQKLFGLYVQLGSKCGSGPFWIAGFGSMLWPTRDRVGIKKTNPKKPTQKNPKNPPKKTH